MMPMVHIDRDAQASTNGSIIQVVHPNRLGLAVASRFAGVGPGFGLEAGHALACYEPWGWSTQ